MAPDRRGRSRGILPAALMFSGLNAHATAVRDEFARVALSRYAPR